MGSEETVARRVVFDTGVVVSALLIQQGELAWLRRHWAAGECTQLVSRATAEELVRVLAYPKFRLSADDRQDLLGEYLAHCETVRRGRRCPVTCRDPRQPFLDLAYSGRADALVSGDEDHLALAGRERRGSRSRPPQPMGSGWAGSNPGVAAGCAGGGSSVLSW